MRREQTLADRITSSSVWRSVVRHGYPDTQRNQALIIASNVFLGREIRQKGIMGSVFRRLDKKAMREESLKHLNDLKVSIKSVRQAVETL